MAKPQGHPISTQIHPRASTHPDIFPAHVLPAYIQLNITNVVEKNLFRKVKTHGLLPPINSSHQYIRKYLSLDKWGLQVNFDPYNISQGPLSDLAEVSSWVYLLTFPKAFKIIGPNKDQAPIH